MTKDIDIYAIGNGLVDLQFQVSDAEIETLGLPKGEMRQSGFDTDLILSKLEGHKRNICSGGSAANSVIAISGFGGRSCYTTVLGDDDFGRFYKHEFDELGIGLNAPLLTSEQTGKCIVLISPDSERTMNTVLGANHLLSPANISTNWIKRSKWIYLEGYELTGKSNTEALMLAVNTAKCSNTKISVTFSDVFIISQFRERIEALVKFSDLTFCNEKEAELFTGNNDFDTAFTALAERIPNVIVTRGADGCKIKFDGQIVDINAFPANPVDSTGAGDMFAGTFLYGITNGLSLTEAGNLASFASSKIVSQFGARLNPQEYASIKHEILKTI